MTDNTQELDEILEDAIYDNIPELNAIYGRMAIDEAKQAILDWHNKQIEEVLDRLIASGDSEGRIWVETIKYVLGQAKSSNNTN